MFLQRDKCEGLRALNACGKAAKRKRYNNDVGISEARAIAVKALPGKITYEELEKENGGNGLRHSFDIKRGTVTQRAWRRSRAYKKQGAHPD